MATLPLYLSISMLLITFASIAFIYSASNYSKPTLIILLAIGIIQSFLSLSGFYLNTTSIPPRFILLLLPAIIILIILFTTKNGLAFIDQFNLAKLTILHTIRIPVELVLYGFYIHKFIPQIMTFEGRNFDILAGITAAIVYYYFFVLKNKSHKILLVWNFIALILLLNIVVNAILSAPSNFQQFAFDQPNIALSYFPFVLLPSCIVPIVLFSHLASIRKLLLVN